MRGLAHPVAFLQGRQGSSGGDRSNGDVQGQGIFSQFGAVPVSPQAFFELLKRNETILLFPGGVQEAYHNKGDDYKVFWPTDKIDFLRMATIFNAIIVPFSAIGIADSFNIIADKNDILDLPFGLGDRAKAFADSLPQARYDSTYATLLQTSYIKRIQWQRRAGGDDVFISPIAVPKIPPSRVYFLFHKPYDTLELKEGIMARDKTVAKLIYNNIRSDVENWIEDLKSIRSQDPYSDFLKRAFYETVNRSPAPFR